jgi:acyl-coenzyme A synthetase/AMP-(fatty) acid ligase
MFSVTDGREGFPAQFLQEPPEEGIALRIVHGELMARGGNAMISYDRQMTVSEKEGGWLATGDLAEVRGDRVIFNGRSSDVINVGGRKVFPLHVETALRGVPGVSDIRVYAKKNSLAGELVAADVVLAPGLREESTKADLWRVARQILQPHEIPRIVRIIPKMSRNEAVKVVRREMDE